MFKRFPKKYIPRKHTAEVKIDKNVSYKKLNYSKSAVSISIFALHIEFALICLNIHYNINWAHRNVFYSYIMI